MALLRCKMCGGDLKVVQGASSCTCEFCGTEQTVPTVKDENIQGLFNRANLLRMRAEFDKAEEIYEKILQIGESEAEAYWGVILCKYGVEYVEDPKTFKRIPTCHRTSFDSILADEDYKSAIKYADVTQRSLYEAEAGRISDIQKGILEVSRREEPYDVFICYKETDDNGNRTQDSVIANDIYYELTKAGYKVFYAAISLENKLGTEYEPYIFAALNSAKVMLAVGTKPEYFNAVWVKNEWSRFLKLMKKDRDKKLFPCYRDMDAYELPIEFAHLQGQDMSKIGFITDLVRGISKVIVKEETKEMTLTNGNNGAASGSQLLLRRATLALEDGEWDRADEFCEQALNMDPDNAEIYVAKLMAEVRACTRNELKNSCDSFENSKNYMKAIRLGSPELKKELEGVIEKIRERNRIEKLTSIYDTAEKLYLAAEDEETFMKAAALYKQIPEWKDSEGKYSLAIQKAEEARKEAIYDATSLYFGLDDTQSLKLVVAALKALGDYKDAKDIVRQCEEKIIANKEQEEQEQREAEKLAEKQAQEKKKKNTIRIAMAVAAVLIVVLVWVFVDNSQKQEKYDEAMALWENGSQQQAVVILEEIASFKDSSAYIAEFKNDIIQKLVGHQWQSSFISDKNKSNTKWEGFYFLSFHMDGTCVVRWDGKYSGGRNESSVGSADARPVTFEITDTKVSVLVQDYVIEVPVNEDPISAIKVTMKVYNTRTYVFK